MQNRFTDVLESVESLQAEEKEMLMNILRSRMIEERRTHLRSEIEDARSEFEAGMFSEMTADEIMNEVLS